MLPASGTEGQKWESDQMHNASASISNDSFMSNLPWLHVLCSPTWRSFIMPSRTERGRAQLMYLRCTAASWNRHGVRCIISWFFYAQNTSSTLTSSQLLHLISPELIWCESPGLYHRYNQVHVCKNKLWDTKPEVKHSMDCRSNSADCFNGQRACPLAAFAKNVALHIS